MLILNQIFLSLYNFIVTITYILHIDCPDYQPLNALSEKKISQDGVLVWNWAIFLESFYLHKATQAPIETGLEIRSGIFWYQYIYIAGRDWEVSDENVNFIWTFLLINDSIGKKLNGSAIDIR